MNPLHWLIGIAIAAIIPMSTILSILHLPVPTEAWHFAELCLAALMRLPGVSPGEPTGEATPQPKTLKGQVTQ